MLFVGGGSVTREHASVSRCIARAFATALRRSAREQTTARISLLVGSTRVGTSDQIIVLMTLDEDRAILLSTGVTEEQLARCDPARIRSSAAAVPENHCCFCRATFRGWGNNPFPVLDEEGAVACGDCNAVIVLPQRYRHAMRARRE